MAPGQPQSAGREGGREGGRDKEGVRTCHVYCIQHPPTCTSTSCEVSEKWTHVTSSPRDTRETIQLVRAVTLPPVHITLLTTGTNCTTSTHCIDAWVINFVSLHTIRVYCANCMLIGRSVRTAPLHSPDRTAHQPCLVCVDRYHATVV